MSAFTSSIERREDIRRSKEACLFAAWFFFGLGCVIYGIGEFFRWLYS